MGKDGRKILLIEDDEDDYVLVRELLSEVNLADFSLEWVQTYEEGFKELRRADHDAYLLDYRLGSRNGLELIREARGAGCDKPIILLTGQGDHGVDMEAMRSGAADYLVKAQLTSDMLERSIRYSIARKVAEMELKSYRNRLEELVKERTEQLETANEKLRVEIVERKKAENSIREQKEFLSTVINSLHHPFYVINAHDYTIQMANLAAAPGGLPPNMTCHALTHNAPVPCSESEHVNTLKTIMLTGRPLTTELLHYDPEGNARYVEVHGHPILDGKGDVAQIVEYSFDITDRKRAEEELYRREQEYRALVENSPDVVMRVDRQFRRIFVNQAIETMTGYPSSHFVGTTIYEPDTPDRAEYVARMAKACTEVLSTGEEQAFDFPYPTTRGTRYFHMRLVPEYSKEGRIESVLSIGRDITDLRQVQEELRRARDELELRVQERTAELAESNKALKLDEARLEALWRLSQMAEASTKDIADFTLKQQIMLTRSKVGAIGLMSEEENILTLYAGSTDLVGSGKVIDKGLQFTVEKSPLLAEVVRKREPIVINEFGASTWQKTCHMPMVLNRFMSVPVVEGGQVVAIAMAGNKDQDYDSSDIRQITLLVDGIWKLVQRGKAEKALRHAESLAAIGRALSAVAHDIKTPLVAIGGFTRLVHGHLDKNSSDRAKLEIVIKEVHRLETLLKHILDFSRPLELDKSPHDVNNVIVESLSMVEDAARERGLRIETRFADLPPVSFDAMRMKQVLINLVMNAIQASPPGKTVSISTRLRGKRLQIDITDCGCGIPALKRDEVFATYFSTKKEGTGLGLAISKKIVESHQGNIEILDNVDGGVTFRVSFPAMTEALAA